MVFNSLDFMIFFPVVVLIYFAMPQKVKYIWLLICSYYFYMCWNPTYIILIAISTFITYLSGICIEKIIQQKWDTYKKDKLKKICVVFSFIINLGILGYFKYFNFFINNLNAVLSQLNIHMEIREFDILLPVGISFYTFQALSYTADVYRGDIHAEKNLLKYALFVSFFPQLVAGPIERSSNLLKQINERHYLSFNKVRDGLLLMLWGLFLKIVIADRIAIFVDTVYGDMNTYGGYYIIVASILFAFQIYCDFAGYSTIALGAAEIMGFHLTDNFNAPYYSCSTAEFWRRWHITLFSWFQDYIYFPLGGSRKGKFRKYCNIMIVFLISGLWHGATWSFVIWGAINGLYQILGGLFKPIRDKIVKFFNLKRDCFSHRLFQTVFTFCLIDFSWIFFRSGSIDLAFQAIDSIFHANNIWILFDDSLFNLGLDYKNFVVMIVSIFVLMVADYLKYHGVVIRDAICRQELWFRWIVFAFGIVTIIIFGIWGSGYDITEFIYFQF